MKNNECFFIFGAYMRDLQIVISKIAVGGTRLSSAFLRRYQNNCQSLIKKKTVKNRPFEYRHESFSIIGGTILNSDF